MVCKHCGKPIESDGLYKVIYFHKGAVGALVRYCYPVTATSTTEQIAMTATPLCTKDYLKALKSHGL